MPFELSPFNRVLNNPAQGRVVKTELGLENGIATSVGKAISGEKSDIVVNTGAQDTVVGTGLHVQN